jgi:hypothetical protein
LQKSFYAPPKAGWGEFVRLGTPQTPPTTDGFWTFHPLVEALGQDDLCAWVSHSHASVVFPLSQIHVSLALSVQEALSLFAEMHLKDKANSDTGSDGPLISRVDLV